VAITVTTGAPNEAWCLRFLGSADITSPPDNVATFYFGGPIDTEPHNIPKGGRFACVFRGNGEAILFEHVLPPPDPWREVFRFRWATQAHVHSRVHAIYFIPEDRGIMDVIARKNRIRRKTLKATANWQPATPTLRPRIAKDAAVVKLVNEGLAIPEWLERRHCVGLERVLRGVREI